MDIVRWINAVQNTSPRKSDQDGLDACLCLLVALCLAERKDCLMVGDRQTGYIVVPYGAGLAQNSTPAATRLVGCRRSGYECSKWILPD